MSVVQTVADEHRDRILDTMVEKTGFARFEFHTGIRCHWCGIRIRRTDGTAVATAAGIAKLLYVRDLGYRIMSVVQTVADEHRDRILDTMVEKTGFALISYHSLKGWRSYQCRFHSLANRFRFPGVDMPAHRR